VPSKHITVDMTDFSKIDLDDIIKQFTS
jgi:hypothetical protein